MDLLPHVSTMHRAASREYREFTTFSRIPSRREMFGHQTFLKRYLLIFRDRILDSRVDAGYRVEVPRPTVPRHGLQWPPMPSRWLSSIGRRTFWRTASCPPEQMETR